MLYYVHVGNSVIDVTENLILQGLKHLQFPFKMRVSQWGDHEQVSAVCHAGLVLHWLGPTSAGPKPEIKDRIQHLEDQALVLL